MTFGRYSRLGEKLRASETEFGGAHINNDRYFTKCTNGVLRLNSVCWLHVAGSISDVPTGRYEIILSTKITRQRGPDFIGDWVAGTGHVSHTRDWPSVDVDEGIGQLHMRNYREQGRGGRFLSSLPTDSFSAISFGVVDVKSGEGTVGFSMGGGDPNWCSNLEFEYFELRRVGFPWVITRLFLLARQDTSNVIGSLPDHILRYIMRMIA